MTKYDIPMMKTARIWADMSKCKRGKIGAVIADEGRIISIGYNGTPSGFFTNDCEKEYMICPICDAEDISKFDDICYVCNICKYTATKQNFKKLKTDHSIVIHAEANAILFAAKKGLSLQGTTLYVTMSPCKECSKMIVQSGIKKVVYLEKYRDDGLNFLQKTGVEVERIELKD